MENEQEFKSDELVVDYWNKEKLESCIDIIFELFKTTIILGDPIEVESSLSVDYYGNEIKIWVSFFGDATNIAKAKKFVCAICDPEFTQRIKLDSNLSKILSNSYLNALMENHQVYLTLINEMNENKLLVQGSLNDVSLVKCLIDLDMNKMLFNENYEQFDDNYDNEEEDDTIIVDKNELYSSYEKLKNDFENFSQLPVSDKNQEELKPVNNQSVLFELQTEPEKASIENSNLQCSTESSEKQTKKRNRRKRKKQNSDQTNLPEILDALDLSKPRLISQAISPSTLVSNDDNEDSIQIVKHIEKFNEFYNDSLKKNNIKKNTTLNSKKHVNSHPYIMNKNINEPTPDISVNTKNSISNLMELNVQPTADFQDLRSKFSPEKANLFNDLSLKGTGKNEKTNRNKNQNENKNKNNKKEPQRIRSKSVAVLGANKNKKKVHAKRYIVIDGSNIAREHGKKDGNVFSCKGIKIVVDYFLQMGHDKITVILPRFRRGQSDKESPTKNPEILDELEKNGYLSYSPSRYINGKLTIPYDDRIILKTAVHFNAAIVSNDNYRDLMRENEEWKKHIENNLLQYSFVNDLFMIPEDPFGRNGPKLEDYLNLSNNTEIDKQTNNRNLSTSPRKTESKSIQAKNENIKSKTNSSANSGNGEDFKNKFERSSHLTKELRSNLNQIFPNCKSYIDELLNRYKNEVEIKFFVSKLIDYTNQE